MIVAKSKCQAEKAAKLVHIVYSDHKTPVLTIKDALEDPDRIREHILHGSRKVVNKGNVDGIKLLSQLTLSEYFNHTSVTDVLAQSATIVEGEFEIGSQYHFFMENHVSLCVPLEDGIDVYCSTQEQDAVQCTIASVLNFKKSQ